MNQYERRFYEDIHKLVIIQERILKQLEKLNEPKQGSKNYMREKMGLPPVDKDYPVNHTGEEETFTEEVIAHYFGTKEGK